MGNKSSSTLVNEYSITKVIGQGSFGTVVKVKKYDRFNELALKLLNGDDPTARQKFKQSNIQKRTQILSHISGTGLKKRVNGVMT